MKIFKNRKFLIMFLSAWCNFAVLNMAEAADYEAAPVITMEQLYDICSTDIKQDNFNDTSCGMYIQGFLLAWTTSITYFIGAHFEGANTETVEGISKAVKDCKIYDFSAEKAAKDFLLFMEGENDQYKGRPAKYETAGGFFWDYFLKCGKA